MVFNRSLFKSDNQNWKTPENLYNELNKEFNFDFDPCPSNPNFDGLKVDWGKVNFVNPPYKNGLQKAFIIKGFEEWKKGKTVVFLIPARTDTRRFHEIFMPFATEIRFLKGRLRFNDQKNSAPFPSMIVIFNGGITNGKKNNQVAS